MATAPEIIYRFRFAPREDGRIDVWLRLTIDDELIDGPPVGWISDKCTIDAGPANLSDNDASSALRHLERAIDVLVKAERQTKDDDGTRTPTHCDSDPPPPLDRPSGLRLRR